MADYLPTSSIPSLHSPSRKRVHDSSLTRSSANYLSSCTSIAAIESTTPSCIEVMEPTPIAVIPNGTHARTSIHRSPSPKKSPTSTRTNGEANGASAAPESKTNGFTADSSNGIAASTQRPHIVSSFHVSIKQQLAIIGE